MAEPRHVLVIRLGALGDVVQSFAPFAAIRAHHPGAAITLMTTAPFADWLRAAPWFDAVAVDARPAWWQPAGLARLARTLRGFDLVYDLQTSGRSTRYFWLAGRPAWSGIGAFRRYRHRDPGRNRLHTLERQRGQLRDAGIADVPPLPPAALAPLGWRADAPAHAVLVPGAARPGKRWPLERFTTLATRLHDRGWPVMVLGSAADRPLGAAITAAVPDAHDLTGRTDLFALTAALSGATVAIGNDTGPMHLAAALGRTCIVLFGGASDPALTAPRMPDGGFATVLRAPDLADLPVDRVAAALP